MAFLTVFLPWPDPALSPNRKNGKHWTTVHAKKTAARDAAYRLAKASTTADLRFGDRVPLHITFHSPDRRARDADNLLAACKPMLDGLADALGVNDSRFDPIVIRRANGTKPGQVEVKVGEWMEF